MQIRLKYIEYIWFHVVGLYFIILGYFSGIESILGLLIITFVVDSVLGIIVAKRVQKEKFDAGKIWKDTMPRIVMTITILLLSFAWDSVYGMESYPSHKGMGWFITGALIANITKNAWRYTQWEIFEEIGEFISRFRKKNEKF